jgi:signal transduction histidine kinase/CheY-like chemotaxis protein
MYTLVGVMVFLITFELVTLKYTVNILSSVRGFVTGEGLWSKAQKNALIEIQNYIIFRDEKHYAAFKEQLGVTLADREGRIELAKPNRDMKVVQKHLEKGRNHPSDIPGMANLLINFSWISYMQRAIGAWMDADLQIDELLKLGEEIRAEVLKTPKDKPVARRQELLQRISELNTQITVYADRFSFTLGEASRWVEHTLLLALLLIVLAVESTGLIFTYRFSRGLLRTLNELNSTAQKIGTGDFTQKVAVRSRDELGQLAMSLNQMSQNLFDMSQKKSHAEETNQIKSMFLANMSHEIRTPMGAILGFIELLKEPDLNEKERRQYLEIVSKTGEALVTIINDILDLSKVEAGKVEISKEVFSLRQFIRDLELLLRLRSEDKGIGLEFQFSPNVPDQIHTDILRLRQILLNIIGNAIKFTAKGSVTVKIDFIDNFLFFIVKDTGIGISKADSEKLFAPFAQADVSIQKVHRGTGLGLVLAKDLAVLLGGDVMLEQSIPGEGSVFSITIESRLPENQKSAETTAGQKAVLQQDLKGRSILVVEDSVDNQVLFSHILQKAGMLVTVAENGRRGADLALQGEFDLVLMDMQMPVLDGYSATQELRAKGFKKPIIALTAHAMKADLNKCLNAGCNDILTKPVNKSQLIATIGRYIV